MDGGWFIDVYIRRCHNATPLWLSLEMLRRPQRSSGCEMFPAVAAILHHTEPKTKTGKPKK